ncbi:heme-degrading domain-containing protein [Lentzea sp.]|uniref:heme-degrading domain-containing protein n=1 Tax=Lentzea sp. TaxID=56099 RepID=UPI002BA41653|nr:heme-degrading domain-containing protein [Lentzea sp.]HUQ55260.1 heme-degrading domain-containing protein [Lentzea sp.]
MSPTSEELLDQERRLQFTRFGNDVAIELGLHLLDAARDQGLPVAISVRRNGHLLFHAALPGTAPDNDRWLERKARVVDLFGHSSFYVGTTFREKGTTFEAGSGLDPVLYAAHGGVFPVIVRGTGPVGTAGVSGLPQADDHEFVVTQLESFLNAREAQ